MHLQHKARPLTGSQFACWLMTATEHAKNFSLFGEGGGGFHMTPLYDVLPVWPIIGNGANQISPRRAKLAMALRSKNAHYPLHEISPRHGQALARQSGVPEAFEDMQASVQQVRDAPERVALLLPAGFPQRVFEPVRAGMLAQAGRFAAEMA